MTPEQDDGEEEADDIAETESLGEKVAGCFTEGGGNDFRDPEEQRDFRD